MKRAAPVAGLAAAAVVFIVDQLTKWLVTGPLGINFLGASREIVSFFDLRFVQNMGVSLGLLRAESDVARWALVAMTAAISAAVTFWMWREEKATDKLALGLVLGGAIGNIVDRVRFGYVVDFADLHFGEWRPFLVFNVADAAITIGVLILLVRALLIRDKPAAKPDKMASENVNA
ncbi:signal peptidase II [Sphingomonas mucosissima]|uniref:Lipoprotein signal peptidase n=1 Tax=Sphingomonas mucosissima TaxID=370959 RepID=A0A245ZLF0_9SPHN|nr:signal peptidase II [Sphingomonas mucosissima]OWK30557.1 lipoprotein signal peptidase [Sphingomonas mucosissima]